MRKLPQKFRLCAQLGERDSREHGRGYFTTPWRLRLFFNGGRRLTPYGVTAINGVPVAISPPVQAVPAGDADAVGRMMRQVVLSGTGKAAFISGVYTAGKTGATQDYRDGWSVCYVRGNIIAAWLGNDNNTLARIYLAARCLRRSSTTWCRCFNQLASPSRSLLSASNSSRSSLAASCTVWISLLSSLPNP